MLYKSIQAIEQPNFTFCLLGKHLETEREKEIDALKSLIVSDKTDELKHV